MFDHTTMRTNLRRLTRLSNGFSRKFANLKAALSLWFWYYNFCRIHKTIRVSPAMEAKIDNTLHDMEWIVGLIDERAPKPGPRGPYKEENSN